MRLAVAATAPLGADVLERLAAKHDVAYLLTRPDRPQGRGRKVAPPPAKDVAERLGLDVRQPERLAGFDPGVDTVVVAAYGVLIPEDVLDRALWLNVHPSLLPRWRGAAPIERALMAGDEETGVTIIELVPELANRVRALSPHIGARAELHGRPVTIWTARVEGDELVPVEVQPDGRRRMTYDEFLRGLR